MIGVIFRVVTGVAIAASTLFWWPAPQFAVAACSALPTANGTDTMSVNVPASGTYRAWVRILAPDTASNSVLMQLDQSYCNVSVGGSSMPAGTWTWASVDNLSLTSGAHSVMLASPSPGVKTDRIIFTTDTACVPSGTGDNCATAKLGDLNGDGKVDVFDLSIMLSHWGTNDAASDLNKDGIVNIFDLSILLSHWG